MIRNRKPLPVYDKGENVRDWLYVEDHARAIDVIFHEGKIAGGRFAALIKKTMVLGFRWA